MKFNREKQKKLKELSIFTFLMLAALCLNAQTTYPSINLGAKTGINRSNIILVEEAGILGAVLIEPIYKPHIGAIAELALFKKFAIQSELNVGKKGFSFPITNYAEHHNTIDIPILAKFSNLDDFDIFSGFLDSENINASFMVGPYFSFVRNLIAFRDGEKEKYKVKDTFITKSTWGLQAAASTEYNISNLGIVGLQFGAQLALRNAIKINLPSVGILFLPVFVEKPRLSLG